VWADIDIADAAHKNKTLPHTREEAWKIMEKIRYTPDIVVNSGHGFHCYWLFKEPIQIKDADSRLVAANLLHDWMEHLKQISSSLGWEIDSVCDMARVLRVPGTFNHKFKPAIEVKAENVNMLRGACGISKPSGGVESQGDDSSPATTV
jgi:hypothetical protein